MNSILKISEAASLALHTMQHLAGNNDHQVTNRELATVLGASEAHLSKVLQRLAKVGLVHSVRGPKGGFTLGPRGGDVTLLEVYEAIDGPLSTSGCLLGHPVCRGENYCMLGGLVASLNRQVKDYLKGMTLAALPQASVPSPSLEN
jgi:Rrf2 family protein